jgi:hypothetical protein
MLVAQEKVTALEAKLSRIPRWPSSSTRSETTHARLRRGFMESVTGPTRSAKLPSSRSAPSRVILRGRGSKS